jgi:hypothetical protein
MITKLLWRVAVLAIKPATVKQTGLEKTDPLGRVDEPDP